MRRVTCFDAAKMVIDEATRQFAPGLLPNDYKMYQLKAVCDKITDLADRHNGVSYETEVNDETCDISITLVCSMIIVQEIPHPFIDIADQSKSIQISGTQGGENVSIRFTFPGIWGKAIQGD